MPTKDMDKWQGSGRGGLGVSEAARPTSLIPAKANAEVVKTVQMPLRLLANAPGSSPIDNLLCVLCMLAWWSIDQWRMQIIIVVFIIIIWLGTHISSRVVAGVVVKLKYAHTERGQDAETLFLSRQISMVYMQSQQET